MLEHERSGAATLAVGSVLPAPRARDETLAGRRRFVHAALAGSLIALALDVLMLMAGHASLDRGRGLLSSFYDAQARALMHGHLSVAPAQAGFEGFVVHGHTYLYFGLVPALLRIPVLAFTHRLDGRLTELSMLLGFVVLLAAGAQLHWRVRRLVRPEAAISRADSAAALVMQIALGAGAVPLYLASWAVVYHEAELWGAALSLAAIAAVVGVIARPSTRRIAAAGLLAALAVNARVSVGLGPILALGAVAVGLAARLGGETRAKQESRRLARALRPLAWLGPLPRATAGRRELVALVLAAAIPLALSVAVNEARFHTPFGLPLSKQVDSQIDANRKAVLAANHGSLFGARFVATTLLATVRPDAVGGVRAFPFVGLPHAPPTVVGRARFDTLQQSLSAPTSMPLFCLLLLCALAPIARRARLRPLAGTLAATALAYVPALTIAYVTTRYLADLLPLLVLGGLIGLHSLLTGQSGAATRRRRAVVVAGAALLTLGGIATNGGAGLVSQRLLEPDTTQTDRAAFAGTQQDIDRFLGRRPHGVRAGAALPATATGTLGDLFVLDRCAGLYTVGFGGQWLPVERTERSGWHMLDVSFPATTARPGALLTLGVGARRISLVSQTAGPGRVAVSLRVGDRTVATGSPIAVAPGRPARVTLSIDPFAGAFFATVQIDAVTAVSGGVPDQRAARAALGTDPGNRALSSFAGSVAAVVGTAPVCHRIAGAAGLLG